MRRHVSCRVLGISSTSSKEEIREAYRRKIKEFHPDVYQGDGRYVLVVREAYESLVNKMVEDKYMEDLAEELFPLGAVHFSFPELDPAEETTSERKETHPYVEPRATFSRDFSQKAPSKAVPEKEWAKYAFPRRLVPQDQRISLVLLLLKETRSFVPPVHLENITAYLGIHLDSDNRKQEQQAWRSYSRSDSTLCGGSIFYGPKDTSSTKS